MNALDELKNKDGYSSIEWAIVEFSDEKYDDPVNNMFRRKWLIEAAAELTALRARVGELERERDEYNRLSNDVIKAWKYYVNHPNAPIAGLSRFEGRLLALAAALAAQGAG